MDLDIYKLIRLVMTFKKCQFKSMNNKQSCMKRLMQVAKVVYQERSEYYSATLIGDSRDGMYVCKTNI